MRYLGYLYFEPKAPRETFLKRRLALNFLDLRAWLETRNSRFVFSLRHSYHWHSIALHCTGAVLATLHRALVPPRASRRKALIARTPLSPYLG